MNTTDWLSVILRILHIGGAVVALGGAVFARLALRPVLSALPEDQRQPFHDAVRRRFNRLYMAAIAALLISGVLNYIFTETPAHAGQSAYHAVMGAKILLGLAVMFLGSALLGRSQAFEGIRKKAGFWMGFNIFLAFIVIALAAWLRAVPEAR